MFFFRIHLHNINCVQEIKTAMIFKWFIKYYTLAPKIKQGLYLIALFYVN